jgi:lysozyme
MNLEQAKKLCIASLLLLFEGTGPTLPDGSFKAYSDPGSPSGLPITIAWGLTYDELGNKIKLGDIWSLEKATRVKSLVLDQFAWQVIEMCPTLIDEPDNKFAAVLSFTYNVGATNVKNSTLRKKILVKDWEGAAQEFIKWNKASGKVMLGLTRRRQAEADLFMQE